MKVLFLLIGIITLCLSFGCSKSKVVVAEDQPVYAPAPAPPSPGHGPPPWAPAHGYRAKYRYHYYSSSYVYYDIGRRLYFYYRAGDWQVSVSLPAGIDIEAREYVVLDMDTDKPYQYHSDVVKHYPPGQAQKATKEKGKGKWD